MGQFYIAREFQRPDNTKKRVRVERALKAFQLIAATNVRRKFNVRGRRLREKNVTRANAGEEADAGGVGRVHGESGGSFPALHAAHVVGTTRMAGGERCKAGPTPCPAHNPCHKRAMSLSPVRAC